jgi:rhodanese-related sulfurtransferase
MKLKRVFLVWCLLFIGYPILAQEIDVQYKKMIERKYDGFPLIQPELLEQKLENKAPLVILDTRELNEYNVSHIPGSIYFGYDNKNWTALNNIPKNAEIIVYCSIGVRSQNIGKELAKKGYKNVSNLYGGVFLWADQERILEDKVGKRTYRVHVYDKYWGKWVKKAEAVYE